MPHAKFQSRSIKIERFFQLSFGEREGEREKVSKLVSEGPKIESSAFAQRTKAELKTKCTLSKCWIKESAFSFLFESHIKKLSPL